MKKQYFFLILFCILLSSLVFATDIEHIEVDIGYVVQVPHHEYVKVNEDFRLNAHVLNRTNGVLIDDTETTCYIHMYNSTGNHIITGATSYAAGDFFRIIGGGNFSTIGERRPYTFACFGNGTSSMFGGTTTGYLTITENAQPTETDTTTAISITLFLLIIAGALFYLGIRKYDTPHKYLMFIFRRSALVIAFYFMTLVSAIMANFSIYSGLGIKNEMFLLMEVFGWGGYVAMVILVVGSLIQLLGEMKTDKQKERVGDDDG